MRRARADTHPEIFRKGLCRDTFYQRDSKLFAEHTQAFKSLHARNKYHGFDNKARRLRDGFVSRGAAALLGAGQRKSRADNHNNCQRGGVYSSADAHGQHLGAGYYLVQKHLFARLKI